MADGNGVRRGPRADADELVEFLRFWALRCRGPDEARRRLESMRKRGR